MRIEAKGLYAVELIYHNLLNSQAGFRWLLTSPKACGA